MTTVFHTWRRASTIAALLVLVGCASSPSPNITLVPANQVVSETEKDGLFTQPLKFERSKPGCRGECPKLTVDSLVFPGHAKLTELVDHALATMTGLNPDQPPPYDTIAGFERYFWETAAPRDEVLLAAKTRYRSEGLTVLELDSWQYFTGAAHGVSATQFLNWDNSRQIVLGLAQILEPGKTDAWVDALKAAHGRWLETQDPYKSDPDGYLRLWPFQPSDNFALTDLGVVVKYGSYELAPYSSGQPELLIPYNALQGILRPGFLPRGV